MGRWAVGGMCCNELHVGHVEFKFTVEHSREKCTKLAAGYARTTCRVRVQD